MPLITLKCPYCKTKNNIHSSEFDIDKPYYTCQGCMDTFKIVTRIKTESVKEEERYAT